MRTDTSPVFVPTDPDDVSTHLSDWLDILVHPRRATERITYMYGGFTAPGLIILCGLAAGLWLSTLGPAVAYLVPIEPGFAPAAMDPSDIGIVVFSAILGGALSLYIGGGILTLIGKWLGGSGSYGDVVLAWALSTIPITLVASLLAVFNWLALKLSDGGPNLMMVMLALSVIGLVLAAVYRIVVLVFGLSGVHRYSAWRSLATLALMWTLYLALNIGRLLVGLLFL
jgi:hypothetical protein